MRGQINVADALEQIQGSSVRTRTEGLANLRHILRSNKTYEGINDSSFFKIYETLFGITLTEQSSYLKAKTSTTRSAAEGRLSACANALRVSIEAGLTTIRTKTVRAILRHVQESLLLPNGKLCEPICVDYAKCLSILLGYRAHVEHLEDDDWTKAAQFCVKYLEQVISDLDEENVEPGAEALLTSATLNGLSYRSSRSHFKDSGGSQDDKLLSKQVTEQVVSCLASLTATYRSGDASLSSRVLSALIDYVRRSSQSVLDAFIAMNNILTKTRTESVDMTRSHLPPIIRLIRLFWHTKASPAFRNEMIRTLLLLQPYFVPASQRVDATVRSELKGVLDVLQTEYSQRNERDQLRLEDVRLRIANSNEHLPYTIGSDIMELRCATARAEMHIRAESNWATVSIMASLCSLLAGDESEAALADEDADDINPRPRKRQRVENEIGRFIQLSASGTSASRVCSLQVITFFSQHKALSDVQVVTALDAVSKSCAENNSVISSWALVALASIASRASADARTLIDRWSSIWQTAVRTMSNAATCRASCHLLTIMAVAKLIPHQQLAEFAQSTTMSITLNGPMVFADSVMHLLIELLRLVQHSSPTSLSTAADNVLSWTFRSWIPSRFEDKSYASIHMLFDPPDILALIHLCIGHDSNFQFNRWFPAWDTIGHTWMACNDQAALMSYLLLTPDCSSATHTHLIGKQAIQSSDQPRVSGESVMLANLIPELRRISSTWIRIVQDKPASITFDMFSFVCSTLSIANCIAFCTTLRDAHKQLLLQREIKVMFTQMVDFVTGRTCTQDKVDALLSIASCTCSNLLPQIVPRVNHKCEEHFCEIIHRISTLRQKNDEFGVHDDDDLADLATEDDSQDSRRGESVARQLIPKTEMTSTYCIYSLRSTVPAYAAIRRAVGTREESHGLIPTSSPSAVDYIVSLSTDAILCSHLIVSRLSEVGVDLLADDVERLLDHYSETLLNDYSCNRSEAAHAVVLDTLANVVPLLTSAASESLFKFGLDLYDWYAHTALPRGLLSSSTQLHMATLLLQLCRVDLDYGRDEQRDVPSARTSLFQLLKQGSITVLFNLADKVPQIFGLYVLSNHEAMFEDVQKSLPNSDEWPEGLAMRLLFLSRLGSSWRSLLRQCVYHIFETAARVAVTSEWAARSMAALASSVGFESSRHLFHIFATQLFFTWIGDSRDINDLPFAAFQYPSLKVLILENEAEITAHALAHRSEKAMQAVNSATQLSTLQLITRHFAKCAAYCFIRDIEAAVTPGEESAERHLRKLLPKEQVTGLLWNEFPAIIGQFYISMQLNDLQDSWLDKRSGYGAASKALAEIKAISYSDRKLPDVLQPFFKSRHLCDHIERLCRRGIDPDTLRVAPTFSVTARILIDSIDPTLGSLQTCIGIRKLRLLISMSGNAPFGDFPLEMLIHSLRPFLSDSQCADDVIGILQYLFTHGREHLTTSLDFLFGTTTLMVLRMRQHSMSRQESTTQESQHKQTLQKMRRFQTWLVENLRNCIPTDATSATRAYTRLVRTLENVNLPGNARQGSPESSLIMLLIGKDKTKNLPIPSADRDEALVLLAENFELPSTPAEDCLANDADCVLSVQKLWTAMHIPKLSDNFIAWAAGAIGRAYAAVGARPSRELPGDSLPKPGIVPKHNGIARSHAAVAEYLSNMLYSRDRRHAGMADYTLRSIIQSFATDQDTLDFQQLLPSKIVPAIASGPCGYVHNSTFSEWPLQTVNNVHEVVQSSSETPLHVWVQALGVALCKEMADIPVLSKLQPAFQHDSSIAHDLLPYVIHVVLAEQSGGIDSLRSELSRAMGMMFSESSLASRPKQKYMLQILLYLRSQKRPGESTDVDRLQWLDMDWLVAAEAANLCGLSTTALMFAESALQPQPNNRKSSNRVSLMPVPIASMPQELLLSVFKSVDEPDSFYGVEQPASLDTVLERLDYEGDGYRSLMFRSAQTDTNLRRTGELGVDNSRGLLQSLSRLNLDSVSFTLLSNGIGSPHSNRELMTAARRLQQWDVATVAEPTNDAASSCFHAFKELSRASNFSAIYNTFESLVVSYTKSAIGLAVDRPSTEWLSGLAALVESKTLVKSPNRQLFCSEWSQIRSRQAWMKLAPYPDSRLITSSRQSLLAVLGRNDLLSGTFGLKTIRGAEIESLIDLSSIARTHGQLQEALSASNQLGDLVEHSKALGLKADAAVMLESASVLWEANEVVPSVQMLRGALVASGSDTDAVFIGQPGLLAQLAHQLAEARLEKPDEILSNYLRPAIGYLGDHTTGEEAGKVFHEFATFCDKQLSNPSNMEDLTRMSKLRQRKTKEVEDLAILMKRSRSEGERHDLSKARENAKRWLSMDDAEYQRLKQARDTFLQGCLQNYQLALQASDNHDLSVLRFFALWLENSDDKNANRVVSKHLQQVPSWKFVVLMNQLMSRLEFNDSAFQTSLKSLVTRVCAEHPYQSLHHLYASSRRPDSSDQSALSRFHAASAIVQDIRGRADIGSLMMKVFKADDAYVELTSYAPDKYKSSSLSVSQVPPALSAAKLVPGLEVPPPTITVPIRRDGVYTDVPVITRFRDAIRIMSGISKPKRLSVHTSDGREQFQLFKGRDDLRQDAIMEQVFAEVSKMLRNHKGTRQRDLHVRTYNVIPLTNTSGIIEFVPHSISLGDYLQPAHELYYPKDWRSNVARDKIQAVQKHSTDTRVKEFRRICDHIQPVLRHFFFERFKDPDDWFAKRTAYTRTTAAISMLGHVLGLGDRHCQNIMLDEKTGEVVHIDLGIAFEAGRVLPVPELVPFRLSRDVVDGMGITKTEGVFRRCCEFTMDALREDRDRIMTLLNVLRYDPLYEWSISPVRAKQMQEQTERVETGEVDDSTRKNDEVSEAERALAVVEKKLANTLSTAATVNELIQQATDERHLATLFMGWSAYY